MPLSVQISVVIITYNEERNIRRCLESVREVADEIVVVDSFSTDTTQAICLAHGVKFIQHSFEGHIQQKNFALTQSSSPYVLSLDADEALSEELKKSILVIKNNWRADAYEMSRLTNYCGHWIKHTDWYPDRKIRLFDKQKAQWAGANPHDKIELISASIVALLKGDILHYSYYSISQHLRQLNYFTDVGARAAFEQGKKAPLLITLLSPLTKFIKSYFIKLGLLDGYYGFIVCAVSAFASFIKYVKLRELYRQHEAAE